MQLQLLTLNSLFATEPSIRGMAYQVIAQLIITLYFREKITTVVPYLPLTMVTNTKSV